MRLHEIIGKDPFYAADFSVDAELNPEFAARKKEEEKEEKARRKKGCTTIVTKDVDYGDEKWSNIPEKNVEQSPGYRGENELKDLANLPYKKYDKYDPNYFNNDVTVSLNNSIGH